jgi:hypothetical protein
MRAKWAALLSSASLLLGSASASAQEPLTLTGPQLDGVIPAYPYDPSRDELRLVVETATVTDPDLERNTLLVEDAEFDMAAEQMADEEPEARCTPARRALLALSGRSESVTWEAAPQQAATRNTSASLNGQATGAMLSQRGQRLAAAIPDPTTIDGSASPGQTASANTDHTLPAAISNAGSSMRRAPANGSQPAAIANLGSTPRRVVPDSSRPPASAGAAGQRAPAAMIASRKPLVEVPHRTVRPDGPSRSPGPSAARVASGPNAADIVARVRSGVDRALSGRQGGAFSMRR